MQIRAPRKLIEVALPLDDINIASAREKSIRHGHPSTLHLWWARRPLAAARAVEAHASDLNPVAVLINKAMIEIPPKFAGRKPVGPEPVAADPTERETREMHEDWSGASGLAEDVRRYGHWMRKEAERRIGHLYPKIEITEAMAQSRPDLKPLVGEQLTVIAWLWARTVRSPNPAGVISAKGGKVKLHKPADYPSDWDPRTDQRTPVWEALHQLIRALSQGGESAAGALLARMPERGGDIRRLAFWLYTLCERKGWAEDARHYNELVTAWHAIETASHETGPINAQSELDF